MIELEATECIGAAPYERTESRLTPNATATARRVLTTEAGDVDLRTPTAQVLGA